MFCFQCRENLTTEYFMEIDTDEKFCGTCHDLQVREMKNIPLQDEVECERNDCGFLYYYLDKDTNNTFISESNKNHFTPKEVKIRKYDSSRSLYFMGWEDTCGLFTMQEIEHWFAKVGQAEEFNRYYKNGLGWHMVTSSRDYEFDNLITALEFLNGYGSENSISCDNCLIVRVI